MGYQGHSSGEKGDKNYFWTGGEAVYYAYTITKAPLPLESRVIHTGGAPALTV